MLSPNACARFHGLVFTSKNEARHFLQMLSQNESPNFQCHSSWNWTQMLFCSQHAYASILDAHVFSYADMSTWLCDIRWASTMHDCMVDHSTYQESFAGTVRKLLLILWTEPLSTHEIFFLLSFRQPPPNQPREAWKLCNDWLSFRIEGGEIRQCWSVFVKKSAIAGCGSDLIWLLRRSFLNSLTPVLWLF